MKPQPMSDAEMRRILQKTAESIDAPNIVMTHWLLVARAIRDARDAQWAAMIGEPVALSHPHMLSVPVGTPLYAIKETP